MVKKMIAGFLLSIVVMATVQVSSANDDDGDIWPLHQAGVDAVPKEKEAKFEAKFDAKYKSCYENCLKECLVKDSESFCEVKCDEDCSDKEVAGTLSSLPISL